MPGTRTAAPEPTGAHGVRGPARRPAPADRAPAGRRERGGDPRRPACPGGGGRRGTRRPGRGTGPAAGLGARRHRLPGRPLDSHVLERSEQAYQMDFSHVRVHDNPVAQRSAEELDALAYTSGPHIVLGKRDVSDQVLYEEVDHVRQQMLGPVPGTDNGKGRRSPARTIPSSGAPRQRPQAGSGCGP
ncbi:DUF4157 domain-containing protein [Actinomadura keratinilytica]